MQRKEGGKTGGGENPTLDDPDELSYSARKKFANIVTIGASGTVSELLKHYHYC